ncbi:hypothetical protein [Bdellovibrio bacteriovorus]|nr:hypothetical protein [Bdellovibrio bacteriovorus]
MKALITTLLIALSATAANAAEPKPYGIDITNKDSVGASVWITVYNFVGDIGDNACLQPGQTISFHDYMTGPAYTVRAEVKQNRDCSGATYSDLSTVVGGNDKVEMSRSATGTLWLENKGDGTDKDANPLTTVSMRNNDTSGHSAWVTIYNTVGRIGDSGCVRPGNKKMWKNYAPPFKYNVRVEVKQNEDCSGGNLEDTDMSVPSQSGVELTVDGSGYFHLNQKK